MAGTERLSAYLDLPHPKSRDRRFLAGGDFLCPLSPAVIYASDSGGYVMARIPYANTECPECKTQLGWDTDVGKVVCESGAHQFSAVPRTAPAVAPPIRVEAQAPMTHVEAVSQLPRTEAAEVKHATFPDPPQPPPLPDMAGGTLPSSASRPAPKPPQAPQVAVPPPRPRTHQNAPKNTAKIPPKTDPISTPGEPESRYRLAPLPELESLEAVPVTPEPPAADTTKPPLLTKTGQEVVFGPLPLQSHPPEPRVYQTGSIAALQVSQLRKDANGDALLDCQVTLRIPEVFVGSMEAEAQDQKQAFIRWVQGWLDENFPSFVEGFWMAPTSV